MEESEEDYVEYEEKSYGSEMEEILSVEENEYLSPAYENMWEEALDMKDVEMIYEGETDMAEQLMDNGTVEDDELEFLGEYGFLDVSEEQSEGLMSTTDLPRPNLNTTVSNSDRSKASLRVKIQDTSENLKIEEPPAEPCMKDRMRKWLNRDRSQPVTESFLGRRYSKRTRSIDRVDDPCNYIFFKKFVSPDAEKFDANRSQSTSGRYLKCGCREKIPELNKHQSRDLVKEDSRSLAKYSSSGGTFEDDRKRFKCTCSQDEVCFGIAQQPVEKENSPEVIEHTEILKDQQIPGPCTCNQKKDEEEEDEDASIREKLHHLMNRLFELKSTVCHCKRTGFMTTRVSRRLKKGRCICKKLLKRKAKLLRLMKEVKGLMVDRQIETMERKVAEEKINKLFQTVGPEIAAEFQVKETHYPRSQKKQDDSFTKMIMREFGTQLRKYRLQNLQDGSIFRGHKRGDHDSSQYVELPNGSKYYGQFSRLGMEGKCIYQMLHGPVFVGHMVDGKMEGHGKLIYPNGGIVDGTWVNGTLFDPKYTFSDGLKFKPYNWKYCRMPDRRFVSEIVNGMNSPDNVQLSADHPARQIPKGCLDAGEGFYDPQKRVIIHPSTGKIIRIVGEQEGNWILQNCRREWFEEVPFSRYMYENWYAGTVFPPPGDEPEWFDKEFAKVLLPYTDINDVIKARRLAMEAASKATAQHEDEGYKHFVLPPLNLN